MTAPDADARTLHIRCGSDLQSKLQVAGFEGDYYEHSYPYLIGPVRDGPGSLEQRARFLTATPAGDSSPAPDYATTLRRLQQDEQRLLDSSHYERVVIWSEADVYDQLVLVRLLAHYAEHPRPRQLEMITVASYPGIARFIGLGQLTAEALKTLWPQRQPATPAQLALGLATWSALRDPDPRALAALMRGGTPDLPLLAAALHRHLRELPDIDTGLGLTQHLALEQLAHRPATLNQLFHRLTHELDPLPGQGDLQFRDRIVPLTQVADPLLVTLRGIDAQGSGHPPWTDLFTITPTGRAVLRGDADFHAQSPPARWVGGVEVSSATPDWRWSEATRDAVLR